MLPPIIDTHVHLWDVNRLTYPWLKTLPTLDRSFGLADYRAATAGLFGEARIDGIVFVQCETLPEQALAEAQWVDTLAQEDPLIRGIVAYAPLERGVEARAELDALAKLSRVRGVRRHLQFEEDVAFCLRPDFVAGVRALADYDFSFDLLVKPEHLANATRLVEQCPEVSLVLDHLAKPNLREGATDSWARDLRALSTLPNVVCKVSGLVTEAEPHAWTIDQLRPSIAHVLRCFGAERVLYGGDWPVVNLAADYGQWFDALIATLDNATEHDLRLLFNRNAARIYRLEQAS